MYEYCRVQPCRSWFLYSMCVIMCFVCVTCNAYLIVDFIVSMVFVCRCVCKCLNFAGCRLWFLFCICVIVCVFCNACLISELIYGIFGVCIIVCRCACKCLNFAGRRAGEFGKYLFS